MKRIYLELIEQHFQKNRQMLFLMGPCQVGKTTLSKAAKSIGSKLYYLNWDNLFDRELICDSPLKIAEHLHLQHPRATPPLIVFDEIHKYKKWKLFIKGFFDTYAHQGELRIIVTGSARLEAFNTGGESLMGRYFRYRIHPLSVSELVHDQLPTKEIRAPKPIKDSVWKNLIEYGGFPEPFLKKNKQFTTQWHTLREQQFFQDEVRGLTRIYDIHQMELLSIQLTRAVGMLTSYSSLAKKVRVSIDTVRRWMETLTNLYFCFPIHPWSKNVSRSLLKEPKVYLWDWSMLQDRGARAENLVASHLLKAVHFWTDNGMGEYALYFLRDKEKREVDFIVTKNNTPWFLVEVKAGEHKTPSKSLAHFQKQTGAPHAFQVELNAEYEKIDCFAFNDPVIVPAKTFLSQLI